ncbi:MAG: virulence RhuM family protein [Solidesulfovibrio sp. DCME]|uniref:virulence RhuM family protein n=1 Tax=Solidesulfovibrio sp. DCME TaxID=3447380 RepID=UPI003D120341
MTEAQPGGEILLYQTEDGRSRIQVRFESGTVWLSQRHMAELFQTTVANVNTHLRNIFGDGELAAEAVIKESLITATDGKRYKTKFYNLDAILSVGYRVRSHRGTQFRQWATQRLREYLVKGFALDDERLKEAGGGDFFDELLARIRDIRASERVFWRKVLDIYTTSMDSHLGKDIDGTQWDKSNFENADLHIVEGIAQHYTKVICHTMDTRLPGTQKAFETLLCYQSTPYTIFKEWNLPPESGGEVVRLAMIACRSQGITEYPSFQETMKHYENIKQNPSRQAKPA